jgi:hypothetical protein
VTIRTQVGRDPRYHRRMRCLALVVALGLARVAVAQEEPPPAIEHPSLTPEYAPPSMSSHTPSPIMVERWHRARVLYGVGSVTSLIGTALSLSSVLAVAITGYPCNPISIDPNDSCNKSPPKPTDPAPLLAYIGSSTSALGFVLTASGLGLQHHLLYEMGGDTSRGVFAGGTILGLLGFLSVGTSYVFAFVNTNTLSPHDQGIAIIASSLTGTGLCLLGGLLYTIDAGRLKTAWDRLGTF